MSFLSTELTPQFFQSSCSPLCNGHAPNPVSYIFPNQKRGFLFSDERRMEDISLIPSLEIKGKKVFFISNNKYLLYYENSFIDSIHTFLEKINLPKTLNQDLLDKIATIANFLSEGTTYEYMAGTAKQTEIGLTFLVKKGVNICKVTLSSFKENSQIYYCPLT